MAQSKSRGSFPAEKKDVFSLRNNERLSSFILPANETMSHPEGEGGQHVLIQWTPDLVKDGQLRDEKSTPVEMAAMRRR